MNCAVQIEYTDRMESRLLCGFGRLQGVFKDCDLCRSSIQPLCCGEERVRSIFAVADFIAA